MALNFPFEMFMQAAEARRQRQQEKQNNIVGIGQGIGQMGQSIGQMVQANRNKKLMDQLMVLMQTQGAPQQGPPLPPQGYQQPSSTQIPPGQPMTAGPANIGQDVKMPIPIPTQDPNQQPMSGIGAPAQDNTQQINALLMKLNPQGMMDSMIPPSPLQKSEIAKNFAMAKKYGDQGQSAKLVGTIFRNSSTGEMTDDPSMAQGPEWKEYKTTQGDVLNKLSGQTSGKARNAALSSRAEVMARGIDARQIDRLAQTVGLTTAQRNLLQQNNMRSNRAIEIASQGPITWQEFGAMTTDFTAMMHGGSPQVNELHTMAYPSWQQDFARMKTYATSHPTENVPDSFKNRVINDIKGVQKVDNRYLAKNSEFMQKMLSPTIRGGIGQFKKPISDMTNTLTESGGEQPKSFTSVQAAESANLPKGTKVMINGRSATIQ